MCSGKRQNLYTFITREHIIHTHIHKSARIVNACAALRKTQISTRNRCKQTCSAAVRKMEIHAHLLPVSNLQLRDVSLRNLQLRAYAISPNTSMLNAPARAFLTLWHTLGSAARRDVDGAIFIACLQYTGHCACMRPCAEVGLKCT